MKLIFLDIDGVLNNLLQHKICYALEGKSSVYKVEISQNNFDILKYLTTTTDSKIVISSSWRKSFLFKNHTNEIIPSEESDIIKKFKKLFSYHGWKNAPIIGITPSLSGFRGQEVATYLDDFSKKNVVDDYIIFDDDSDFIINKAEDLAQEYYVRCGFDKKQSYSKYWENQRLILVNRLVGLSYDDLIEVLKIWSPESDMMKLHTSYIPYIPRYGKKFT